MNTTVFFSLAFLGLLVGMVHSFSTVLLPTSSSVHGYCSAFVAPSLHRITSKLCALSQPNDDDDEAEKLKKRANELHDQICKMEEQ